MGTFYREVPGRTEMNLASDHKGQLRNSLQTKWAQFSMVGRCMVCAMRATVHREHAGGWAKL